MRRWLIPLLAVFCATPAFAGGLRLQVRDLNFETRANGQILDSLFVNRTSGIRNSAERADTTATFSSLDWTMPPSYGAGGLTTAAGTDTCAWLRVTVVPDPAITNSGDTLGVIIQVSDDDGSTWTNVAFTGPRIDPDVAAMGQAAILETGSTNGYAFVLKQTVTATALNGVLGGGANLQTPTDKQIYGFRAMRFIFTGDHVGKYKCKMIGFQAYDLN